MSKKDIMAIGGKAVTKRQAELLQQLHNDNSLTGGSFGVGKRISIRGSVFRQVVDGTEIRAIEDRSLNVIIARSAPVSRLYYAKGWDEEEVSLPTCWSADCRTPAPEVPESDRQASKCNDCPQNIKGSGQNDTRACRFQQRLAILLEGEVNEESIHQLIVPAKSIFGAPEKDGTKMPLQAYGKFLKAHNNTPAAGIITELRFDTTSSTPKLFFRPIRPLSEDELEVVLSIQEHEDTLQAIALTINKLPELHDGSATGTNPALPKGQRSLFDATVEEDEDEEEEVPAPKKKKPAPVVEEDEEEEDEEEAPVVRKKKAKPVIAEDDDLASMLDDWDD